MCKGPEGIIRISGGKQCEYQVSVDYFGDRAARIFVPGRYQSSGVYYFRFKVQSSISGKRKYQLWNISENNLPLFKTPGYSIATVMGIVEEPTIMWETQENYVYVPDLPADQQEIVQELRISFIHTRELRLRGKLKPLPYRKLAFEYIQHSVFQYYNDLEYTKIDISDGEIVDIEAIDELFYRKRLGNLGSYWIYNGYLLQSTKMRWKNKTYILAVALRDSYIAHPSMNKELRLEKGAYLIRLEGEYLRENKDLERTVWF